jgi:SAM-dependent methyltransferase
VLKPELGLFLRCPSCGSALTSEHAGSDGCELVCPGCRSRTPVTDGIPRFVTVPENPSARRTQESFGYEWTHFNDWRQSGETNFNDYFEGANLDALHGGIVLDAGCGMGRHARHVARYAGRVIAVDFSRAIDQAARNVADFSNVDCVQADLLALPFDDESFHYAYSLGVLHHLEDTERALKNIIRKLRPGGHLRIYLYWKRHGWKGQLLRAVTLVRRATTKMPFGLLRFSCLILSAMLYTAVVVPYRALTAMGIVRHVDWPLFVYSKYPFRVLYNDQFDRFSAPIEKRYDASEVRQLLESAGLTNINVKPCYGWLAEGTKPGAIR